MLVKPDLTPIPAPIPKKRRAFYDAFKAKLKPGVYELAFDELTRRADAVSERPPGKRFITSSFEGSERWQDGPYWGIYEASGENVETSGWFFGLVLWDVIQQHPRRWCCDHYELNDVKGMTYFTVD